MAQKPSKWLEISKAFAVKRCSKTHRINLYNFLIDFFHFWTGSFPNEIVKNRSPWYYVRNYEGQVRSGFFVKDTRIWNMMSLVQYCLHVSYVRIVRLLTELGTLCCISLCRCCFGLETRVITKVSTHPCYPINVDWFSCGWSKKNPKWLTQNNWVFQLCQF